MSKKTKQLGRPNIFVGQPQSRQSNKLPASPEAQINLAVSLHQQGRLAQAEVIYDALLKTIKNNAVLWHLKGVAAAQTQRFQLAISCFEEAIQLNPNVVDFQLDLGKAHHHLGHLDKAVNCFRKAIDINPSNPVSHYNLGLSLHHLGKQVEALLSYQCAINLQPNYTDAHYNCGNAHIELNQLDEAIASHQRSIEINPNDAEAHWNQALAYLLL